MKASDAAAAMIAAVLAVQLAAVDAHAQEGARDPADWREVSPDRLVVMDTTKGRILIETAPEFAPSHIARFSELIRKGFYDGTIFHRVVDDFMAQGGDPSGDGTGGSGQNIRGEFSIKRTASMPVVEVSARGLERGGFWHGMPVVTQPIAQAMIRVDGKVETWLSHCGGMVSTARGGSANPEEDRQLENSADSQFFLMRQTTRKDGSTNLYLDREYTAWGRIVGGLDVARSINIGVVGQDRGFKPDKIVREQIASDMPQNRRPRVWVQREDGPTFKAKLAALTAGGAPMPDVCDIEVPTVVEDPKA